jgi:hypothetical protein
MMVFAVIPALPYFFASQCLFAVFDRMNLTSHITLGDHLTKPMDAIRLLACLVMFSFCPGLSRFGLELPGHMLSGAIAYQVLRQENPQTIEKVKAVLEKHPWYANQWQARLEDVPVADHGFVLFMQAARWADDIRMRDKQYHRGSWHYINWPFKPHGQPASVQTREPEPVNILTALAENENVTKNENDPERRAIALAWLFHLVGDIHQPYTRRSYSRLVSQW